MTCPNHASFRLSVGHGIESEAVCLFVCFCLFSSQSTPFPTLTYGSSSRRILPYFPFAQQCAKGYFLCFRCCVWNFFLNNYFFKIEAVYGGAGTHMIYVFSSAVLNVQPFCRPTNVDYITTSLSISVTSVTSHHDYFKNGPLPVWFSCYIGWKLCL